MVLVDFWTYTCVNWLRTLPYLREWDVKNRDAGLTIVGVHTPEFAFEHHRDNVIRESANLQVAYPIAIDSDYSVWQAFANHYWPAVYLADAEVGCATTTSARASMRRPRWRSSSSSLRLGGRSTRTW